MLEKDGKSDSWKKTLKFISNCPVCKTEYKPEAVKLLNNENNVPSQVAQDESRFVHFTCHNCKTNFMAMVMMISKGISTVGMITDLNFTDVEKLYKMPPLTVDELIEARQFINSKNFKL